MCRPQLRQDLSRVWQFGEVTGPITHCFVCHKDLKGYDGRKLRYHLVALGGGRQGRCQGVTPCTSARLASILEDEGYNPDGSLPSQPHPPDGGDDGGGADAQPPDDDDDDGGGSDGR